MADSPASASRAFQAALQTVTSTVTNANLIVSPKSYQTNILYSITFSPTGEPVRLRASSGAWSDLLLGLTHQFRIVDEVNTDHGPEWRVTTAAYEYYVYDSQCGELLGFHWQPGSTYRGPDRPHLHVSAQLPIRTDAHGGARNQPLHRLHIPTRQVTLESVVRMLIDDFGVQPVRADWDRRLTDSEQVF